MIAALMLYSLLISALIAAAALVIEHAMTTLAWPRRSVWVLALITSLALPAIMSLRAPATTTAAFVPSFITFPTFEREAAQSAPHSHEVPANPQPLRMSLPDSTNWNDTLQGLWIASSIGMLNFYLLGWIRLRRAMRRWPLENIDGVPVHITRNSGPAAFGILRPQIIVPYWLRTASTATRQMVLAHEGEHVAARDPQCLMFALLLVAVAPWNPLLWWQLKRLRFAVEVDCDARVLRTGADASSYGEVLLAVGQRILQRPLGAIALTESPSQLERRIRIMMKGSHKYSVMLALGCAALCASLVAAAAQLNAPSLNPNPRAAQPQSPPTAFVLRDPLNIEVEKIARARYPEVFAAKLEKPVLIKLLLGNDLSVERAERKDLPLDGASSPVPNNGFELNPLDERITVDMTRADASGAPSIHLSAAVRIFNQARSQSLVENAMRKVFRAAYASSSDSKRYLITAIMNNDGSSQSARLETLGSMPEPFTRGHQLRRLEELGLDRNNVGVIGLIDHRDGRTPIVLYAFAPSGNPAIDADPYFIATNAQQPDPNGLTRRQLADRYFPDLTANQKHAHELPWILMNAEGAVLRTGRAPIPAGGLFSPRKDIFPGVALPKVIISPAEHLFNRDITDEQGDSVRVAFLWLASGATVPNNL